MFMATLLGTSLRDDLGVKIGKAKLLLSREVGTRIAMAIRNHARYSQ